MLFRINAQSEAFEDALAARGIAYVIRGAARFFDRQEVRQAITLLRGTARSGGGGDNLVAAHVSPWENTRNTKKTKTHEERI